MRLRRLFLLTAGILFRSCCAGTDFAACAKKFSSGETNTSNLVDSQGNSVFYTGILSGFNGQSADRPITITRQACIDYCGTSSDYNTVVAAFQVLTTWVLPVLGLMGQLPYESLSHNKWRNAEAFINWIGAPAAVLTTTLWNIITIGKCQSMASMSGGQTREVITDALYILSCINQYEYPRKEPYPSDKLLYMARDQALLRGVLFPYIIDTRINDLQRKKLEDITKLVGFHLRLQRRRGVYPIYIGVLWFGVAFGLSIALAFSDLGDNSTAHSLALGLLLSWVPIVVFASVVDRNPTSSTHCGEMIERWLFNVDAIITAGGTRPLWRAPETEQLQQRARASDRLTPFRIGEFLGQGRRLRYCGVTDTVLHYITESVARRTQIALPQITNQTTTSLNPRTPGVESFDKFQKSLKTRPPQWYGVWIVSQLIVMACFGMAFMVSFNTPTVGFGCRSMIYLTWYSLTIPSSISLLFQQEPVKALRILMMLPNTLSVLAVFTIMLVQTMNGFNNCTCKTSIFGAKRGPTSGGYMDFQNAAFYSDHYNVRLFWGVATGVGGGMLVASLLWLAWRWQKSSALWKVIEDHVVVIHEDIPLDIII